MFKMAIARPPSIGLLLPPALLSFVAFVLVMIALLAGTGPQQKSLEPYHIIAVNLTDFGQNLLASATSDSHPAKPTGKGDDDDESLWDKIKGGAEALGDDISGTVNNITNQLAGDVVDELGISQWYSLHVMTLCQGMFEGNGNGNGSDGHASSSPSYNLTNCTAQGAGVLKLNLTSLLDHEITIGPLHLNTNQVPIPEKVQSAVNIINSSLLAILVIFALGAGLAGLSCVSSILTILLLLRQRLTRRVVYYNAGLAGTGTLVLLIGSAVVTYVNNKAVAEINDAGKDVGISGIKGVRFITISWIAFGLLAAAGAFWSVLTTKFTQRWVILGDLGGSGSGSGRGRGRAEKGAVRHEMGYARSVHSYAS
ncbi:hypothetical protein F5Y17DRAFT_286489 [Xylariaceae sp. FL0594]|nr:hypothetical protein F5Y17DRAFT_286489 [Xylariaceae sp. FL0594]